jgi:hypothetical protein
VNSRTVIMKSKIPMLTMAALLIEPQQP